MTDKELLQQALDALISVWNSDRTKRQVETILAIKSRLAQPKKEWVGLTEEDIDDAEIHLTSCRNNHESWIEGIQEFAQAIEAKLKEKNENA
jgi:hypothetical protein